METTINHTKVDYLEFDSRLVEERCSNLELTPMLSTAFLSDQLEEISNQLTELNTILEPSNLAPQLAPRLAPRVNG